VRGLVVRELRVDEDADGVEELYRLAGWRSSHRVFRVLREG